MKALGRIINIVGFASGIHIDLSDAGGVTFVCYENGGAQNIDIKESKLGASETPLAVVTELFKSDGVGGVITGDTDDANGGVLDGFPVGWVLPDQEAGGLGTLLLPNTVALVRGGPNPDAGKRLIDYLLGPEVELALASSRSIQIPLNPVVEAPDNVPELSKIRTMDIDFDSVSEQMSSTAVFIQEEFLR